MSKKPAARHAHASKRAKKIDWRRFDAINDGEIAKSIALNAEAAPILTRAWIIAAKVIAPSRQGRR